MSRARLQLPVRVPQLRTPLVRAHRPGAGRQAVLALALCLLAAVPAQANGGVRSVESVGFTVSDLDRSVAFFQEVLGFEKLFEVELLGDGYERLHGVFGARARIARLRLGEEQVELTEYLAPRGREVPPDARSNDKGFQHVAIIVADMERAYRWLRRNKVAHASTGPQTLPDYIKAAAGIQAFYFKDPDGHPLEILQFPKDKGNPKWHRLAERVGPDGPPNKLFLGIDHTAIVVGDTDLSLRFYRDELGFAVAGESENHGTEQEHLNNVFGARLRITGLKVAAGPALEFLEYLAPRDGRPAPHDLRANDLAHWQTTLGAPELEGLVRRLFARHAFFVSPGAVGVPGTGLGFDRGALLRDPDGHALRLVER